MSKATGKRGGVSRRYRRLAALRRRLCRELSDETLSALVEECTRGLLLPVGPIHDEACKRGLPPPSEEAQLEGGQ